MHLSPVLTESMIQVTMVGYLSPAWDEDGDDQKIN